MDGQYEAIVLAGAGLKRLGLTDHISQWLPIKSFLPAPGQGAIAVQCRKRDESTRAILQSIDDNITRINVAAERQFLSSLGGGCAVPVGAYCRQMVVNEPELFLEGVVASVDGRKIIRVSEVGIDPVELGINLSKKARDEGAMEILGGYIHG